MSTSIERVERMIALIPYLKQNPYVSVAEVAKGFGVSEKTIKDDVKRLFMCGVVSPGAPYDYMDIDYEALEENDVIQLTNADFIERPTRLFRDEALSILVALASLRSALNQEEQKLVDSVGEKLRAALSDDLEAQVAVHTTEVNPEYRAILEKAIDNKSCVNLTYTSPHKDARTEREVEPIALRIRNGEWYLHAWCFTANAMRLFRLDRIDELSMSARPATGISQEINTEVFEPSDGDFWADFAVNEHIDWLLEAYPMAEIREEKGRRILRMWSPNPEWLVRFALKYATVISVLEPSEIGERVRTEARLALNAYDGDLD